MSEQNLLTGKAMQDKNGTEPSIPFLCSIVNDILECTLKHTHQLDRIMYGSHPQEESEECPNVVSISDAIDKLRVILANSNNIDSKLRILESEK